MNTIDSIASARSLCDAVGAGRARVLVDCWHVFRGPDSLDDVAACPVDAIAYVQFDDAAPMVGTLDDEIRTGRTWPGTGEFDLPGFVDAVRHTGYDGMVSCELLNPSWHDAGMSPAEFARRVRATCRPYWSD
jgi:sugar phosphate isomerase/epimerase